MTDTKDAVGVVSSDPHTIAGGANSRVISGNPDTIAEVPSAAWGWSGEAPRAVRIAGWVVALMLLAMLRGNHVGHVEDIFLVGFAAAIVTLLVRDLLLRRKAR